MPKIKNKNILQKDNKSSLGMLYGVDGKFNIERQKVLDEVKTKIQQINASYTNTIGSDPIEYLSKIAYNKNKKENINSNIKHKSFNDMMIEMNPTLLSNLFANKRNNVHLFDDYDMLYRLIPQLKSCIDAIVNNIISPDDFTKNSISIFYDGSNLENNDLAFLKSSIHNLEKKYHIEDKLRNQIMKTCIYGEYFIACLSASKEFDSLLTEEALFNLSKNEILLEDIFLESEIEQLTKIYDKRFNKNEFIVETKTILDNIIFDKEHSNIFLCEDYNNYKKDFKINKTHNNNIQNDFVIDISKKKTKHIGKVYDNLNTNRYLKFDKDVENTLRQAPGSFVKDLDPRNLVEIKTNNTVFGYYYIEAENINNTYIDANIDKKNITPSAIFGIGNQNVTTLNDVPYNNGMQRLNGGRTDLDPQTEILMNAIMRGIGTKIDKKYVANNEKFREIIYELLKAENTAQKRIKISFLTPSEVVKLAVNIDSKGNGHSKFEPILFTAYLYLSVLICNEMMKLSRSSDHRTFYVETGVSQDVEGVIEDIIRDMSSKEIHMKSLDSIDSIFNVIGQFTDYYIPMINGYIFI